MDQERFHVWTEIFAGGQWWAAEAAYPAEGNYSGPYSGGPGLQPRTGPWFTTLASGNGVRISGEFGGIRMDLTEAYRTGEPDPEDG